MKQICLNNRMGREKFPCHKFFCVSVWCYGVSQNTIFYETICCKTYSKLNMTTDGLSTFFEK